MRGEELLAQIKGGRDHQDMRIGRLLQKRQREFRHHESAAHIHLMHHVEARHVDMVRVRERHRGCVVHDDVDAAKPLGRLRQSRSHLLFVAQIDPQRQGHAAGLLDLSGGGEDGARQFGIMLDAAPGDDHIGAIARRPQGDGEANAARGAGDEERLAAQGLCARGLVAQSLVHAPFPLQQGRAPPGQSLRRNPQRGI